MKEKEINMRDDRKKITLYMSEQQHKEIKMLCASLGESMNFFIDKAIREKIKRIMKG